MKIKLSIVSLISILILSSCGDSSYSFCDCAQPEKEAIVGEEGRDEFMEYCQEKYFDALPDEEVKRKLKECSGEAEETN